MLRFLVFQVSLVLCISLCPDNIFYFPGLCVVTLKLALQGSGCASMIFIAFSILHYVAEV